MRKGFFLLSMCLAAVFFLQCQRKNPDGYYLEDKYPKIELRSGDLQLTLFKPDAKNGYYRGTRYDWGNQIAQISYKGHTFITEWPDEHDPLNPDHGIGILNEFNRELALFPYEQGKSGFGVRPGIGQIQYQDMEEPKVIEPARWEMSNGQTWAIVENSLVYGKDSGYFYGKRIRLLPPNTVEIQSILENVGRTLLTSDLNCTFRFNIDHQPIDSNLILRLAKEIPVIEDSTETWQLLSNDFLLKRPVQKKETVETVAYQSSDRSIKVIFQLENPQAGIGVQVHNTLPAQKLEILGNDRVLGPHSAHRFEVKTGDALEWRTVLTFYEVRQ